MSEAAKVRLVRCPKCEKLLPEVTEYSVYQCGGCGAVLRAKNKGVDWDTFSEKSDEERINGATVENLSERYDETMNVSEIRTTTVDPTTDGYESDVRSNVSSSSRRTSRDRSEAKRTSLTSKDEKRGVEANDIIQDKPKTAQSFVDGLNNLEYSGEQDRAELLKKIDELRDQLSRPGNSIDKGKEKDPVDHLRGPPHPLDPYASSKIYSSLEDNSYRDKQFNRPTNQHPIQYADQPPPYMHRQEIGGNVFYPPQYAPNHVHGYADPPRSNYMHRGDPYHISSSRSYMSSGHYMDDGMAYMDARSFSHHHHHPSCSCYECHNTRQGVPAPILPTSYSEKYSNVSNDRAAFPYHDYPGSFGSRDNNNHHKFSNAAPLRSHIAPHSHSRYPSDASSEVSGFARRQPPRARHLASSGGKHCLPIGGGAPILSCYNCFELLLLPLKVLANNNRSRKKLRCGACSTIITFSVSNKNLVILFDEEPQENLVEVDNKRVSLSKHDDMHFKTRHSTSAAEEDTGSFKDSTSANKPSSKEVVKGAPPSSGSSLQDHFEYSNKFHAAVKSGGDGNRSGRSEQYDKVLPNKANNNRQILKEASSATETNLSLNKANNNPQIVREVSSATEIDLSSNEYNNNTGTTFDSGEASREGDRVGRNRLAAELFGGYQGSSRSGESFGQESGNVTVNGHLISDRLIKKAEKLAGPIQPGHYWYDFRAGFWGAIGGPCLGIIPPFIEEFNFPMPEHCAGGNTGVFINGRELDQKDLTLLGNRGLPMQPDRSYIVEISGRVIDEDTHEELNSLGKLAPTVERLKHGFGMRATRAA